MAKVVYGQGVSKMSGRLGGSVYANNRGGAYVRNWVKPINPRTNYQENQRALVADASAAWRNLTTAQQDAWSTWASTHPIVDRLGNSILRSGHQAYVGVNVLRTLASDAATPSATPGDPTYIADPIEEAYKTLAVTSSKIEPQAKVTLAIGTIWFCYFAPPVSAGVSFTYDKEKLLEVLTLPAEVAAAAAVSNFFANYVVRYGTLGASAGKKIVCRIMQYDEGQLSNPSVVTGIMAA